MDAEQAISCPQVVIDQFAFFSKALYPRDAAYSQAQYAQKGFNDAVHILKIRLFSNNATFDIANINESYSVQMLDDTIFINATTHFGLARAFASISQLVIAHYDDKLTTDRKAYAIYPGNITDSPSQRWREQMVDSARHYISIKSLKRQIDANSMLKFNVLHVRFSDTQSTPLRIGKVTKSGFHPRFYYSITDLEELQHYAFVRGVIIVPEIELPGRSAALGRSNSAFVANCPKAINDNDNDAMLNVIDPATIEYLDDLIEKLINSELYSSSQYNYSIQIHFAGDGFSTKCWSEDQKYVDYIKQKSFSSLKEVFAEFTSWLEHTVQKHSSERPVYVVYHQSALQNGLQFNAQIKQILHFYNGAVQDSVLSQGFYALSSNGWFLDVMKPGGGFFGSYADTWWELLKVRPESNVGGNNMNKFLGGGGLQWGDAAWGSSFDSHMYPRAISIAEVLWANPSDRSDTWDKQSAFDTAACKLYDVGVRSGPMHPGVPCLGQM